MKRPKNKSQETALIIGNTILKYINPVLISIDGHIPDPSYEMKGKLIIGYVGTLTDYAKEKTKKKGDIKNDN